MTSSYPTFMFPFLSRSALTTLLILALVGCDQQQEKNSGANTQETEQIGDKTSAEIAATEQKNSAKLTEQAKTQADAAITPKIPEHQTTTIANGLVVSDSPEQGKLEQDKDEIFKNNESIVADFGFSGTTALPIEPESKAYCLNQKTDSTVSVEQACTAISSRLASVSLQSCRSAMLTPTGCESAQGFPILVREFAPTENKATRGRILLIGGTHGDELTSISVAFRWIEKLNRYHSGLFHWHIVPMMNPDGVLKKSASRTNHNGVDLNRNLPSDDWERNALSYWENRGGKNPRRYPGTEPASEPETQWLIDEINTFKPDAIISVHAPYGVVDFDALLLNTAPKNLGKLHLNLLGTYPGSLGNYAGINRDIPVITLELPHSWVMPSDNETTKIWEDIVAWLRKNIDSPAVIEQTADAG